MTTGTSEDPAASVVLRNVAELAQRQQQRELGAALALQLFRLLKVVRFHALDNMAVIQQLDQTVEALRAFGLQTGEPLTLLFAKGTVFVAGQLLKASRSEYESALELGEMIQRLGVSELSIQTDAERADLNALARLFQPNARYRLENGVIEPSPRVRLRQVNAARLGEGEESLSEEEQILRTYATSVVVMRRVYENLLNGRYELPHQAKRLAQRLVMLSDGDTPAFLGITAMRNLNHDAAGRAVNRAILAVAMTRQLTSDLGTLARVAMSALFYDVAEPLVSGMIGRGSDVIVMRMTPDAERRLPAATGLVLTALGQLRPASIVRSVIAYEAHWLRQLEALGPLYTGARKPMVAARIVATAHRFNQLLEPDLAADENPSVDDAVAAMRKEARDGTERAMLALLIGALGIFPRGTPVRLTSGECGVVLRTPNHPAHYASPTLRLVYDASGRPLSSRIVVDLAHDPSRQVLEVIAEPDELIARAVELVLTPTSSAAPPPSAGMRPPPPSHRPQPSNASGGADPRNYVPTLVPSPPPAVNMIAAPVIDEPPSGRRPVATPARVPAQMEMVPAAPRPAFDSVVPDSQEISEVEPSAPSSHWRRPPQTIPPHEREPGGIEDAHAPSASGSLDRTPFSHILLYLLDRALTGTLIFTEHKDRDGDEPTEHAVYFDQGVPTKIHLAVRRLPLGMMLVAAGMLEQEQLMAEPISQPPLHEATLESELVDCGLVTPEQIARIRHDQLRVRLIHLFGLPRSTKYSFYNGLDLLQGIWGDIPGIVSPLAVLMHGLREHPEEEAMDRVLTRLGAAALHLHPDTELDPFELHDDERAVADSIATSTSALPDLVEAGHDPEVIRRVVFALMAARCVVPIGSSRSSSPSMETSLVRERGSDPASDRGSSRGSNG